MNQPAHFSTPETPWGKPHTTQLYLHPPFAENIITLRPNTTILIGEIEGGAFPQHEAPGRHDESNLPSAAMVFLHRNRMPDYTKGEFAVRQDGIPIHSLRHNLGDFSMEMESFCNIERVPAAFTKLIVRNNTDEVLKDQFCFTARTAPEFDLLGVNEPDGYAPIEPSVNRWMTAPAWHFETDNGYQNGHCLTYEPSFLAPKKGRRWYISFSDMDAYFYYRRNGNNERAGEILSAQLAYGMTNEYYMGERIDDVDAWFFPWSPNCSANARTITMLCDWYIGPEEFTFYEIK